MPGSGQRLMEVMISIEGLFESIAESNPESEELKNLKESITKVFETDDKLYEMLLNNEVVINSDTDDVLQGLIAAFWIPARKRLQQELESKSKNGNIVVDESSNISI